jgi:hypothetical protein
LSLSCRLLYRCCVLLLKLLYIFDLLDDIDFEKFPSVVLIFILMLSCSLNLRLLLCCFLRSFLLL